jgi:hypothetical protein
VKRRGNKNEMQHGLMGEIFWILLHENKFNWPLLEWQLVEQG